MRFLGQVEESLAEGIVDRLGGSGLHAFDLELGTLGTFKRGKLARVVWIGLALGVAELKATAAAVEVECVRAGLEPDTRAFNAHLTLARARAHDGALLPTLPEPPHLAPWRAHELVLYRSHPGRGGSVYEPLRILRLS